MGELHEHAAGAVAGLVPRHRHPLPVSGAAGHRAGGLPQGTGDARPAAVRPAAPYGTALPRHGELSAD